MPSRRKSQDSSSSSSSSSSDSDSSHKKHKKGKKQHKNKPESHTYINNPLATIASHIPNTTFAPTHQSAFAHMASPFDHNQQTHAISSPPPYFNQPTPPPSGFRLPLTTTSAFPGAQETGQPPFYDADGVSPVFIGSALMERSVHPCKIGPHLQPFASVPYAGGEHGHHGRFDLLPFRPDQMEFVPASHGRIPPGRRPVEGGYEEDGNKLYHAVGIVNGVKVPGKAGEHLDGCRVAFGGVEHAMSDHYEILCWR